MKKITLLTTFLLICMTVFGQSTGSNLKMKFTHNDTGGLAHSLIYVNITEVTEITITSDSQIMAAYYIGDNMYFVNPNTSANIFVFPGMQFGLEFFTGPSDEPYYFDGLSTGFTGDFAPENWNVTEGFNSTVTFEEVMSEPVCSSTPKRNNFEWIKSVSVNADSFTSGKGENTYNDYTSESFDVFESSTINVTLTPGYKRVQYMEYWRIWIDINNDGDYSDEGEMVFQTKGKGMVSGEIQVPDGINSDEVKMKIAMAWKHYPPNCGSYRSGEVEEYTLIFDD